MQIDIDIRKHYRPVQPTVTQADECVVYTEVLPNEILQPFIFCYWQLKTKVSISTLFTYRVVPDGCIDIFFDLEQASESFVMGFCKNHTEFELPNSFNYVGIRFFPTVFPWIYGVNAKELSNKFERLELVAAKTSRFISSNLSLSNDLKQINNKLDIHFLKLFNEKCFNVDARFMNALQRIVMSRGVIDVEERLDTGLSPRQLRRYFELYVGDTAKTFIQVVRFQNVLQSKQFTSGLKGTNVFFEMGYYDQSHFIKEFKSFYGVTPAKAFGR